MNKSTFSELGQLCDCGDPNCPGRIPVHYPFGIAVQKISDDLNDAEVYLTVRTSSWEFDGERTDLHDLLSLFWAAALRTREVASARLVTVLNGFSGIDSEIYARLIVLDQLGSLQECNSLKGRAGALSAESLYMFNLLIAAFGKPDGINLPIEEVSWPSPEPQWLTRVRKRLRLANDNDYEVRQRTYPKWSYFGSNKRGVSLAEIDSEAAMRLRGAFAQFQPLSVSGVDTILYRSARLSNAAHNNALRQLAWLIGQVDGDAQPPLILPVDSHVIGIGRRSVAAVRVWCGRDQFDAAYDQLAERRADEASLFNSDHVCQWSEAIDDGRFEQMIGELLTVERGVFWVRQVGATHEPDDGRDFLVEWLTPPDRSGNAWRERSDLNLSVTRQILVQVKLRRSGVGRSELPGLRDTLEHHRCDGLLVVAFPRITATLVDHLNELRRRGAWWIDWWGRTELEARLRRHPEIAARYPDIIRLAPSESRPA
jgi:hypothetical protein